MPQSDRATPSPAGGALERVTVLDFAKYLPGPYCTWLLSDLGARVIRIENPREVAKIARTLGFDRLPREQQAAVRAKDTFSRGKSSVQIDPGNDDGRALILDLVRCADVLVEDYRPGVMDSMGLGYQALSAINPRLVYASATLCGQTGPYKNKPGHDPVALSVAGALSRMGENPDEPSLAGLPVADLMSGSNLAIGVLAALFHRTMSGRGQHVDIAMSDSSMALVGGILARSDINKPPPRGQRRVDIGIWKTKDGRFICTTDMEARYWEKFCAAVGRPDFIPLQHERSAAPQIQSELKAIFLTRTRDEWVEIFEAAGTQFSPVLEVAEALRDPHNLARGMVIEMDSPAGRFTQLGSPIKLSATPARPQFVGRRAGEDTDAVLAEIGLSPHRIAQLKDTGVVVSAD